MEKKFIVLYNFGLGIIHNTILSYIQGWGEEGTYASNAHISSLTGISERSITRALGELKEQGYIKITNGNNRNRLLKLSTKDRQNDYVNIDKSVDNIDNIVLNIDNLSTQHRQNVPQYNSNKIDNNIEHNIEDYKTEHNIPNWVKNDWESIGIFQAYLKMKMDIKEIKEVMYVK